MYMHGKLSLFSFILVLGLSSCKLYKQDYMFQTGKDASNLETIIYSSEDNYRLKPNDIFSMTVFGSNGEILVDANKEFAKTIGGGGNGSFARMNGNVNTNYTIDVDSNAFLPMIGKTKVGDLTIFQLDSTLSKKFDKYYPNAYVKTQIENRRVFVLGAGNGGIVPILNENTTLIEILATSGGIPQGSKAHNIRLIRGDLKNPSVSVINLSTIEGMKKANLQVENGDIIYVEPVRKIVNESLRDITPILSFTTSIITFIFIITQSGN